jgi:quercetin dioxygenase-like cupin family protein
MNSPTIKLGYTGNVYTRMMVFENVGDVEQGHTHEFDHLTLLATGSLKIVANGQETIFNSPHMIWINKDVQHELTSLEPNTVAYCIHAVHGKNGDVVSPDMIPRGVTNL